TRMLVDCILTFHSLNSRLPEFSRSYSCEIKSLSHVQLVLLTRLNFSARETGHAFCHCCGDVRIIPSEIRGD
ncbi:MAG: hypothetical protein WCG04_07210, partial [Alphaproteobacteria bacterium]